MLFPSTFGFPGQRCSGGDDDDAGGWIGVALIGCGGASPGTGTTAAASQHERDLSTPKKTNKSETDRQQIDGRGREQQSVPAESHRFRHFRFRSLLARALRRDPCPADQI